MGWSAKVISLQFPHSDSDVSSSYHKHSKHIELETICTIGMKKGDELMDMCGITYQLLHQVYLLNVNECCLS